MIYRTLAVSALALGLLSPIGAMADNVNNCSEEQRNKKEFVDCDISKEKLSGQFGAAVIVDEGNGITEDDSSGGSEDSSSSSSKSIK